MNQFKVKIKNKNQIKKLKESGQLAARVLAYIKPFVQAGVTTEYLDQLCHDYIVKELKVIPANVGYHGFTKTACISPNEVVCHGVPSNNVVLKDGDIVNIDVAIIKDGYYGDTSRMYYVGNVSEQAKKLVETTYDAMVAGIHCVRPGATLGDIGHAIQSHAEKHRYSIVKEYCGHGIGQTYHEQPNVLHYGDLGEGLVLQEGMVFTGEPMVNLGHPDIEELDDGWTVVTQDHSLSAQWEHMVAVTAQGFELLTPWPEGTGDYTAI